MGNSKLSTPDSAAAAKKMYQALESVSKWAAEFGLKNDIFNQVEAAMSFARTQKIN